MNKKCYERSLNVFLIPQKGFKSHENTVSIVIYIRGRETIEMESKNRFFFQMEEVKQV